MASFLGGREALMPAAMKRKRSRRSGEAEPQVSPSESGQVSVKKIKKEATMWDDEPPVLTPITAQTPPTKGKKRKKNHVKMESEDVPPPMEIVPPVEAAPLVIDPPKVWTQTELQKLLERVKLQLPESDNVKYGAQCDLMDWSLVCFPPYTADNCKTQWRALSARIRKYRTMTELVCDAKVLVDKGIFVKKNKLPGMPKKPLTPYFRFFMSKREHYHKIHPQLSMTDLSKLMSKEYNKLSKKKKQSYVTEYNKENEQYKIDLQKFKEEHPEVFAADPAVSYKSNPPKVTNAMIIYTSHKIQEARTKGSTASRRDLYEMYRTKWSTLSDRKKLKYIDKAGKAKTKYDTDMEEYCRLHPDYKPREVRTFLTKAEIKIKDHHEGKPEKPPLNGYVLFTTEEMPHLMHIPNHQRLAELSKRWKSHSEEERDNYSKRAEQMNQEFKVAYDSYLDSLPPEERLRQEEDEAQAKAKKSKASSKPVPEEVPEQRPQKPVAALFLYIEEHKPRWQANHPEMEESEIRRMLVKHYNQLPDKDKAKYKKREEELKTSWARHNNRRTVREKRPTFVGEPKRPPTSGYKLYCQEMLFKLTEIPANQRLSHISKRWKALTNEVKLSWNTKQETVFEQYRKDLDKFKKTLEPSDRALFDAYDIPPKSKAKSKKKTLYPPPEVKKESSSEEEVEEETKDEDGESSQESSDSSDDDSDDSSDDDDDDDDDDDEEEEDGASSTMKNGDVKDGDDDDDDDEDDDDDSGTDSDSDSSSDSDSDESATSELVPNGNATNKDKLQTSEVYDDSSDDDEDSGSSTSSSDSD